MRDIGTTPTTDNPDRDVVTHLVRRLQRDASLAYRLGFGTETYDLLHRALVAWGLDADAATACLRCQDTRGAERRTPERVAERVAVRPNNPSTCVHCGERPGTRPALVEGFYVCDACERDRWSEAFPPVCHRCRNVGTIECDECDGEGTVTCDRDHTHDCPRCEESDTRGRLVCPACKGESAKWPEPPAPPAPPFLFTEASAP